MWVWLSLVAGLLQAGRNLIARGLVDRIPADLNTWARFTFNVPYSAAAVAGMAYTEGLARQSPRFFLWCTITAIAQLLGNTALVAAFARANFAQAIALHKFEIVFSGFVGLALGTEIPSPYGWTGIAICCCAALLINLGRENGPAGWRRAFHMDAGALLALACGALFSCTGFALKTASEEFALVNPRVGEGRFEASLYTLFHTTWIEVVILTLWLLLRDRHCFRAVRPNLRAMAMLGASSFGASLCWYWANSIAFVAYVKAVGQIESAVAVVIAIAVWREREVWRQLPGILLLAIGIFLIVLRG